MDKKISGIFFTILIASANTWAGNPIFLVTPNIAAQSQLIKGELGTGLFQVTNNSGRTLNNIGVTNLPAGMSQILNAGTSYCGSPFSLTPNSSCLVKLQINSNNTQGNIQGGPKICFSASQPVYCSQPLQVDQLSTQILNGSIPQSCNDNISNFNYELTQNFDSSSFTNGWGPARNPLQLSPSNPNLTQCFNSTTSGISWQQQRIIAAADFWIQKKLNYCHHYNPDYFTPTSGRNAGGSQGGYCNPAIDIAPGSTYFNQQARWNYSGSGSETINNWINNNYMWYGMDCSNYTAFLYNFAFGITFDSDTGYQAGQRSNGSQDNLTPNQQSGLNVLDNPNAAGSLVCMDNTLEVNHSCAGHGGYLSIYNSSGDRIPSTVTIAQLAALPLQPGDLLYISDETVPSPTTSMVTHVIMWTGKQVGFGANNINPSRIAPDELCPNNWMPSIGDWVITDSHYQGADYRILTQCFYMDHLWGVRRVIQ